VNRRELLVKSGLFLAALTLTPSRASALGGVVLETGTTVPDFDLPGSSQSEPDRKQWSSRDLRGRWLAVYFYPRDFTGGCTIEARGFESLHNDFLQAGAEVIGISADSVDYVNAHGTSTPANDKNETSAIKSALGERALQIPVSSTKSMTGHLLGGSGGIEAVACVLALQHGVVPPTINHTTPDPDCDLDVVPNQARDQTLGTVLSNSFGFGGHNVCLAFKRAS